MKYSQFLSQFFLLFLKPLSLIWEGVYFIRRMAYSYGVFKQNRFFVPVISVGNLTFGGTGKTPFTLWMARYLEAEMKKVMILTRGYKGNLENKAGILRAERRLGFNPVEFGDEPLLLSRGLKKSVIVVGKNRSNNLAYYFEKELPDVVLLDDGHQHLKLDRDVNIVLFDAPMPLSRYEVAPRGYMREGMTALKDCDLVVIGRANQVDSKKLKDLKNFLMKHTSPGTPFAVVRYRSKGIFDGHFNKVFGADEVRGKTVICLAGIASPSSFFQSIEELGCEIVGKYSFPDHHYFKAEELDAIISEAKEKNALLVTTEKDIVKLRRLSDDPLLMYLEIEVEFLEGESSMKSLIQRTLEKREKK